MPLRGSGSAPAARKPLYASLFVQVLVGLLLGIVLGVAVPDFAVRLKILSDAFLKLISMIVAPIVFCVVVHGIAGAGDLKKVGRVGVKALVYFEVMTTVALILGIVLAFVVGPGHGMNIDTSTLDANALNAYADNAHKLKGGGVSSFLLNIIFLPPRSMRWRATTCSKCCSSPSSSACRWRWSAARRARW